jgi:hypothetical protein
MYRGRDDDAVLAEAFDDPVIVGALIQLSRTNDLARRRPCAGPWPYTSSAGTASCMAMSQTRKLSQRRRRKTCWRF